MVAHRGLQRQYLRFKSFQRFTETYNLVERASARGLFQRALPPPGPDGFVDAMITLDGNAQRKSAAQRMDELGLDDKDDKQSAGAKLDLDDGDDLLDLMDSAK